MTWMRTAPSARWLRDDPSDLVAGVFREPDRAVRTRGDAVGTAGRGRDRVFGERAGGGHPADLAGEAFREPKRPIWTHGDAEGTAACRRDRIFGEHAGGRHPADLVAGTFREPKRPVRTGGDQGGTAARRVFGEHARGRHPTDLVAAVFCEPERPIRTGGDADGTASSAWDRVFVGDHPGGVHATDPAAAFREPKSAVRTRDDENGNVARRVFGDGAGGGHPPAGGGLFSPKQRAPVGARRDAFGIAARCRDRVLRDRTVCGADLDGDGRTLVFVVLARDRDRAGSRPDGRYRKRRAEHVLVAVVVAVTMDVAMLCIRGVVLNLGGRHARRGDGGARDVGRTRIHHVRIFGRRGERLRRAAQDKCQRTRRDGDLRRFDLFLFRLDCDRFPLRGLNCTGGRWRRPDRRT